MMKTILLAGASSLALWATSAEAADVFSYTGSVVTWTVPDTAIYEIQAWGAEGGPGSPNEGAKGGLGALMGGDIELTAGTVINIVVGGVGLQTQNGGGGGGGGTWLYTPSVSTPLLVAGGGGGADYYVFHNGGSGQTGAAGQSGVRGGAAGGVNGSGGGGDEGGGGGGWLSAGGSGAIPGLKRFTGSGGYGPSSFAGGVSKGHYGPQYAFYINRVTGGFGGGGGASYTYGGGGGGYSGGGAGDGGGGGGSYISSAFYNNVETSGVASDFGPNGEVTINELQLVPVPEPSTWSLMISGFGFLGFLLRRRFLGRPARA